MRPMQHTYQMTRAAFDVIERRCGPRGSTGPSPSIVVNSMIIRYDEIMRIHTRRIERKFDHEELIEMIERVSATPDGHRKLCRIDRPIHQQTMVNLMASTELDQSERPLSPLKHKELLKILSKNLTTVDLLALADHLSLVLAQRATRLDG